MTLFLLIFLCVLVIANILLVWFKKPSVDVKPQLSEIESSLLKFEMALERMEKNLKDEFQRNRSETHELSKNNREELAHTVESFSQQFEKNVKELNQTLKDKYEEMRTSQLDINKQTIDNIKDIRQSLEGQLKYIREDNTKQLEEMRKTVDEKLQKTLNDRLSQSFDTVTRQLQAVQLGLGEMKNLATDVGGLKKVLSNVKMRGGLGEIQLSMLLEQILAPEQYQANVNTKRGGNELVEFAIKLPGKDDEGTHVWLPVDAKFPKDIYEQLQEAYDDGDSTKILNAQKNLEVTIKKMAKDIRDKYIDPPNTTDFGILFLPFEGIYAEIVRKAALLEDLQRNYKIVITGPTTLAALLNSLQMGFKTLAIQKRSSEVWQVLGAVKKEFDHFGDLMGKAQKNIQAGLSQLDDVLGVRTKAIQKRLKNVETLPDLDTNRILPD